jgi:taurine-pyruvate aminotransferase
VVTMAKGITSAYLPLSATAVRAELFEAFKEDHPYAHFRHVNTFGGNATACALSLKTLELMDERKLVERSAELGEKLKELLKPLWEHPNVGDLRFFGFMAGIELVENREDKKPASAEFVGRVIAACKKRGVLIGKNSDTVPEMNNVLTLSPPLVISDRDLELLTRVVIESVQETGAAG